MDFSKFLPIRPSHLGIRYFDEVFSYFNNPSILLSVAGEILRCNDAALKLYNLTASQVLNHDYFEICQHYHINPPFTSLKEMLETPTKTTSTIVNGQYPTRTIQWTISTIKQHDRVESFYLLGFDITSLTNISDFEKQLQVSIIDHIPNHYIFWKDKDSVYLGCNAALAASVGLKSSAEIVGKTDFDLPTTKEESEAYRADDQQVMESRQPKLNIEEPQTLPDGTKRILLTSKVPLLDENGEAHGIVAIYSDITKQKLNEFQLIEQNQKLEKLSKVKSEFIRNVSHDIRTPLAGIQQILRAMSEGKIPEEEIPELSFSGWEASNKLMELFDQIIDVSKKEHFDFEDRVVKFDLYKLLRSLGKTYEVVAKHKKLTLEIEYSESVPHFLKGKHLRLHRVLMNLLGNALKFTERGSVKLLVEKSKEDGNEVVLRFSVIDTGIGISEEKHEAIFEPFSRLNPSFQGQYPGSGLGLHVVKDYVEKMQGEIYVESEEGEGSMFTCIFPFKLPILDNDNDVVEADYVQDIFNQETPSVNYKKNKGKASIEADSLAKYRILLVEDTPLQQTMGAALLRDVKEYQVDIANSGEEALELTEKCYYDVIYMDIGLPTIDGIETVRQIRSNANNLSQKSFIVALTAHIDADITKQCLDAGMQDVLSKPLTPEKVYHIQGCMFKLQNLDKDEKVVDWTLWLNRLSQNKELAEQSFHMLAKEIATNRTIIIDAYKAQDWPTLKSITHKMKGALAYCGLPRLEAAMKAIEGAAKEVNVEEINKWYQETLDALEEAEIAYNEWVKNHSKAN